MWCVVKGRCAVEGEEGCSGMGGGMCGGVQWRNGVVCSGRGGRKSVEVCSGGGVEVCSRGEGGKCGGDKCAYHQVQDTTWCWCYMKTV